MIKDINTSHAKATFIGLKMFIENILKNSPVISRPEAKGLYPFNKKIPGEWQKSRADSLHHKTDIDISISDGQVKSSIAEYSTESVDNDFPFKNGDVLLDKVVAVLENFKLSCV